MEQGHHLLCLRLVVAAAHVEHAVCRQLHAQHVGRVRRAAVVEGDAQVRGAPEAHLRGHTRGAERPVRPGRECRGRSGRCARCGRLTVCEKGSGSAGVDQNGGSRMGFGEFENDVEEVKRTAMVNHDKSHHLPPKHATRRSTAGRKLQKLKSLNSLSGVTDDDDDEVTDVGNGNNSQSSLDLSLHETPSHVDSDN